MIRLILLAAGTSRRFGGNKLIWEIDGKPMLQHILEKLTQIKAGLAAEITVVTQSGAAAELAGRFPTDIVINPDPDRGISSSIACALESLSDNCTHAVFFVADQPWIEAETITEFIHGYIASGMLCGCVAHCGETGNPCAFSRELFDELMALKGDRGGKKVLMQHLDSCYMHELDDGRQLTDIDTQP